MNNGGQTQRTPIQRRNWMLVGGLLVLVAIMTTGVSYSVTLYRLFCTVTGAGGTTQRADATDGPAGSRKVTVFFTTATAPNLPWRFVPVQRQVTTRLGEETPVAFEAENLSDHDIVGHATFNVTPDKAGIYFKKIECFCFTEERLAAHAKVQMPVVFFVDDALGTDPATKDVDQITLSYTFFESRNPAGASDLSRFTAVADAAGDPATGRTLFATQCAACHSMDKPKVGPALGHVFGQSAGRQQGYHYSPALAASGVTWNDATLDKWLAGPRNFIPGALMPVAVGNAQARRDIISYLRQQAGDGSAAQATPPLNGGAAPPKG